MSVLKIKDQNNNWTQIPTIKGDKGDPFTYADFTPEQLESLKGKDGISPTVSVASDTSEDYRLSFTDETHTVITPNLIPEAEKIFSVYPTDTASGSLASFPDGADRIPLKSCIVRVEPVQDLHGYDSPWPGGGGKNLLENTLVSGVDRGVTFVHNDDGTVTVSGANDGTAYSAGSINSSFLTVDGIEYVLSGGVSSNVLIRNVTKGIVDTGNGVTFTGDGSAHRIEIRIRQGSTIPSNTIVKPMIRLASVSDASYAPYENICPITGWTGCEVQRTGKNLWDDSIAPTDIEAYTMSGNKQTRKGRNLYLPKGTYTLSYNGTTNAYLYGNIVNANGSLVSTFQLTIGPSGTQTPTITLANEQYAKLYVASGDTAELVNGKIQLELGSTATDYEPYQGETYPITFPSEAGAVYGGYIDPINGELVVTHAEVDMGTLSWTKSSGRGGYFWVDLPLRKINSVLISSIYPYNGTRPAIYTSASVGLYQETMTTDKYVDIYDPAYSNVAEIVSALNGQQLVYELAEPIHYPLTPTEIKTLLGQNNIWADTGDTEVEYRASTKMYIDRKITEAVASALNS